jgi:sec-independent protein translocase protein TatA
MTLAAAGPFGLGPAELVIILLVMVMLFGATRLKDLGGSLGQGIKEFRAAVKEDEPEAKAAETAPPPQAASNGAPAATGSGNEPEAVAGNGSASPSGNVVAAVKCPSCGNLNAQGAKFCNSCGTALTAPVSQN